MTFRASANMAYVAEIREKWRMVAPLNAQWFAVPIGRSRRDVLAAELRAMDVGAAVVLCDGRLGSRRRCRTVAGRGGVALAQEFVAVPTLVGAVMLVQDASETARYVADCFLAPPPVATAVGRAQRHLTRLLRAGVRSRTRAAILPGRVVIGHRA